MHFPNLDIYLREADLGVASALPIPVVARWMGVTPPAIRSMLRRGALEPVTIGDLTMVSALSLKTWQATFEAEVKKTLKLLRKAGRKGRPVSYSTLLDKLDRDYTQPGDRRRLGKLIEAASGQSLLDDGQLAGIWAVSKATEQPKYGVWDLAEAKGLRAEGETRPELLARLRAEWQ